MSDLSAAARRRVHGTDDGGFTLVEIAIASVISMVMIAVVFLTASATLGAQEQASEEGATTAPTILAANAVEQLVNNAFVPNGATSITSNCYDTGGTALTGTDGPFLGTNLPTSTSLYLCSIRPGATAAYTYEITFTTCGGTSCVAIDRLTCSPSCSTTRVDDFPGVATSGPFGSSPFSYYYENGSTWTQLSPVTSSNVNSITAVALDFSAPTSHGKAKPAEVARTVLLPSTLGGYG